MNLTGYNNRSVIGDGFTALAVAPGNPQEISAANRFGVWRSLDGGLSWRSLNEDLPNLTVRKLIDRRTAVLADGTLAEAQAGAWTPVEGSDPEIALRARFGGVRSSARQLSSGTTAYAGTADGRLLVSHDSGATWNEAPRIAVRKHRANLGGRRSSRRGAGGGRCAPLPHGERRIVLGRSDRRAAVRPDSRNRGRPFRRSGLCRRRIAACFPAVCR